MYPWVEREAKESTPPNHSEVLSTGQEEWLLTITACGNPGQGTSLCHDCHKNSSLSKDTKQCTGQAMHSNTIHRLEAGRKREHNKGKQNVLQRQFQIMIYKKNKNKNKNHQGMQEPDAPTVPSNSYLGFFCIPQPNWSSTEQYHYPTKTYTLPVALEGKETELSTLLGVEL